MPKGKIGSCSPISRAPWVLTPTSVILEAASQWKKKRVFIPSNSDIVPPSHGILTPMSPIYLLPRSSN